MGDIFKWALRSIFLGNIQPCTPSVTKLMRAMHNIKVHIMFNTEIRPIWGGTFPFLGLFFATLHIGGFSGGLGVLGLLVSCKIARGIKLALGRVNYRVLGGF